MADQQPTNQETTSKIDKLSSQVENLTVNTQQIFNLLQTTFVDVKNIKETLAEHDDYFQAIKVDIDDLGGKMDNLSGQVNKLDNRMDKLDDKLSVFRGDLVGILRKGDSKLGALATKLSARKVLPLADVSEVLALEPFPKSV